MMTSTSPGSGTGALAAPADPDPGDILSIAGLKTYFHADEGVVKAVDGVDIDVPRGKTLCLVGESGSGKSITARSILGLVDEPGRIEEGSVTWRGDGTQEPVDLVALDPKGEHIRRIRGGQIGMVFQEPMASLSPMYTVGAQLVQAIRLHQEVSAAEAKAQAIHHLHRVGIPEPERRFDTYPFQMSGGMCQRVMIAIALCNDPALLIADEPTTALDVTTQARILDLIAHLQADTGMSVLFITHDMGVVAEVADDVTVMQGGHVMEHGTVFDIFDRPQNSYTRKLLAAIPNLGADRRAELLGEATEGRTVETAEERAAEAGEARDDDDLSGEHAARAVRRAPATTAPRERTDRADAATRPLLSVRGVSKFFSVKKGLFAKGASEVRAVDDVSLDIEAGSTVSLVGESGSGKTTLGRMLTRAVDPTAGEVLYSPDDSEPVDLAQLTNRELRQYRDQIRMIFQDPFTSLNPRKTLYDLISSPLKKTRKFSLREAEMRDRVAQILVEVGMKPEHMQRYPHAFSGGQRQRINIARALITDPTLVVADEAVSALDVSVRAQILDLLQDLQDKHDLTYLFISHDLSVVENISDSVAVMHLGKIVEQAETKQLFRDPQDDYTKTLLSAVPIPDPHRRGARAQARRAYGLTGATVNAVDAAHTVEPMAPREAVDPDA